MLLIESLFFMQFLYVQRSGTLHRGYFLNQKNDLGADDFTPRKTKHTNTHRNVNMTQAPAHISDFKTALVQTTQCLLYGCDILNIGEFINIV